MKNWMIFFGVIVAGLLAVSGVAYFASQNGGDSNKEDVYSGHSETEESNDTKVPEPNYSIDTLSLPSLEDLAPSLDREVQYSPTLPREVKTLLEEKIGEVRDRLKNDLSRGSDWLDLGLSYHQASDYEGARQVWEFLMVVDPENPVPVENLARLFHFYLPNYPKAESLFRQAIPLDRSSVTPYLGLHELYRYSYKKETAAAADVLKEAMVQFPQEVGLYLTLGGYYRDTGQTALAKQTFLEGLDRARDAENVELIAEFGKELDRVQ